MANIYDNMKVIESQCNMENIKFLVKLNIIQAPLEAALSLYLIEGILIFSKIYSDNIFESYTILVLIFFPFLGATVVLVIYSIGINCYLLKNIHYLAIKLKNIDSLRYIEADKTMKKAIKNIHFCGFICYTVSSIAIAFFYVWFLNKNEGDGNSNNLYFLIIIIGGIIGALWNVLGYWGDNKVDWSLVLINLNQITLEFKREKFNYMIKHLVIDIIILILFCLTILLILLNLKSGYKPNVGVELNLDSVNIVSHSFFLLSFFTLLIKYIKILYNMYFIQGVKSVYSSYCNFK